MTDRYFGRTTCALQAGDEVLPMETYGPCHKHYRGKVIAATTDRVTVHYPREAPTTVRRDAVWFCGEMRR